MEKKSVFIVDKLVIGYNHIIFNSAISKAVASVYENNNVIFISESVHSTVVAAKNKLTANLSFQPYRESPLPSSGSKKLIRWLNKKIGDIFFIFRFYNKNSKNSRAIFFTCLSASSLAYAGYRASKLKIPVFFFMHGELENFFISNLGFTNKLRGQLYSIFLRRLGANSKVIVMSELIKERLIETNALLEDKIIVIEHPILLLNPVNKPLSLRKIIFGHIGLALNKKSSGLFFDLASFHRSAVAKKCCEFWLIGKIDQGLAIRDSNYVNTLSKNNESLSQDEYEKGIQMIDYCIFTFSGDNYVYRVSGSVMDAIAYLKPFIALKHSYFNYLFEMAGNIGFLCDDVSEMNKLLTMITNRDDVLISQYEEQKANLRALLSRHAIDEITYKLSDLNTQNYS